MYDDDGTNSRIQNPADTDNKTDDYPENRAEYQTRKCRTLTIYNNNNNSYLNSENNVDNNSNNNDDHDYFLQNYYNNSVLTGSKSYNATERNAKNDIVINSNNKRSEKNADNNSNSNNNFCAHSEDNNDNNKDSNFISASTHPSSDSNADNAPPGRNNKNNVMRLPRFIGHQNGIIFRVFKQKQSTSSSSSMVKRKIETKTDHGAKQLKRVQQRDEQQNMLTLSVTKKSSGIFSSTPTPSSLIVMELKGTEQRVKRL